MKNRFPLLAILGFLLINILSNSCKKDTQASVESLISRASWQLASEQVYYYTGSTNTRVDTLNTKCTLSQYFVFNADMTCNYQNFSCIQQSPTGSWHFTDDKLILISNISCKDTLGTNIITRMPFDSAKVVNLGQYSLVLETGSINPFYKATTKRRIVRYGFVRR